MIRKARPIQALALAALLAPLASGCVGRNPPPDGTRRPGDQGSSGTAGGGTATGGSGGATNVGNGPTNR